MANVRLFHSGTKWSECGNRHFDGKQVSKMYYCPIGFLPQEIECHTQFFSIPSGGKAMASLAYLSEGENSPNSLLID